MSEFDKEEALANLGLRRDQLNQKKKKLLLPNMKLKELQYLFLTILFGIVKVIPVDLNVLKVLQSCPSLMCQNRR